MKKVHLFSFKYKKTAFINTPGSAGHFMVISNRLLTPEGAYSELQKQHYEFHEIDKRTVSYNFVQDNTDIPLVINVDNIFEY